MTTSDLCTEIPRLTAGQQHPVDNRVKRRRLSRKAGKGGDRLRRDISLLRGDAAVLDREIRRIAGRIHALEASDPALRVDRDEASGRPQRHSGHTGPEELRHRHDPIDVELP